MLLPGVHKTDTCTQMALQKKRAEDIQRWQQAPQGEEDKLKTKNEQRDKIFFFFKQNCYSWSFSILSIFLIKEQQKEGVACFEALHLSM